MTHWGYAILLIMSPLTLYISPIYSQPHGMRRSALYHSTSYPESSRTVKIYKDCAGDPVGGTLVAFKNIEIAAPGYNTVDLDSEIEIPKYSKFAVVVSIALPAPTRSSGYISQSSASRGSVMMYPRSRSNIR